MDKLLIRLGKYTPVIRIRERIGIESGFTHAESGFTHGRVGIHTQKGGKFIR